MLPPEPPVSTHIAVSELTPRIKRAQQLDEATSNAMRIWERVRTRPIPEDDMELHQQFLVEHGALYKRLKDRNVLVVPNSVQETVIKLVLEDEYWYTIKNPKSKESTKRPEVKMVPKKPNLNPKSDKTLNTKPTNIKQVTQNTSSKRKKHSSSEQWEEWKLKDNEIVNGTYEQDLQNAIMLSKLDYEHNKDLYKKNQETNGKSSNQNKKKKNKVMSINEFLNSGSKKQNSSSVNSNMKNDLKEECFFYDIKHATKKELDKEQIKEKRKKREASIDKLISLVQCQEKLEVERAKRLAVQLELDKAKAEILSVKERNKTLCGILEHGKMKQKADILAELEKLYSEKK
ncbi:hypothetical protein RN001_005284 [Aquatica leii]|uniref:Uncharacterized protein n=1 Tax=Aquatica leii TaxID=1421715 RepID=A0AAN7P6D5_9COLE|nr:hypothetical protein RN001_005284 [Aquatica leii]